MSAGTPSVHGEVLQSGSSVVIVRLHPPLILPIAVAASSTTYRLHVPLGLSPLKSERVVDTYGPAGAGAGNRSPVPILVAWKVPETTVAPIDATESSNVMVAFTASVPPPTSDISK